MEGPRAQARLALGGPARGRLVLARCRELVAERVAITRRPRTLTPRTALLELTALGRAWEPPAPVSGRKKQPEDPLEPTILAVADECARRLRTDPVLTAVDSPVLGLVADVLQRWSTAPIERKPGDVAKLEGAAELLERTYFEDADRALTLHAAAAEVGRKLALVSVCVAVVSELRACGWSDAGLRAWFSTFEEENALGQLRELLRKKRRKLTCFVPVSGWDQPVETFRAEGMKLQPTVGERLVEGDLPPGPYLTVQLSAFDEAEAAERAFSQARRALDAVALVRPEIAETWTAPVVGVESGSRVSSHHVGRWLGSVEPLRTTVDALVARAALGEACRFRVQAMQLRDPLTRLSLLWLGLERLVTPHEGYEHPREALTELVPKAMALHKVQTEIESLAQALEAAALSPEAEALVSRDDEGHLDRAHILGQLQTAQSESARRWYEALDATEPRLATWFERTRRHMTGGQPERLARFFEGTRQRIAWQLLRLQRGHERRGVEAWPLSWVHDLSLHAHHYLTVALLTVMRDPATARSPAEILGRRAAQYDLFLGLLQKGHARALRPEALLEPLSLVGRPSKAD